MKKIATHDSITGEKGHGLLSILVTPFSRTQSKTIQEQLEAGVRYFDLRTRKNKRGWIGAHGLWTSDILFEDVLKIIDNFGNQHKEEKIYVNITYEGWTNEEEYLKQIDKWVEQYKNILFASINIKYTNGFKWKILKVINPVGAIDGFTKIDHFCIQLLIPIPWLWKKLKGPWPEFNDEYFIFVDFY